MKVSCRFMHVHVRTYMYIHVHLYTGFHLGETMGYISHIYMYIVHEYLLTSLTYPEM